MYNIIPDIISRLSSLNEAEEGGEEALSSTAFRNIMKYLLSFIQKVRGTSSPQKSVSHKIIFTGKTI